jgi:hypothetical protein
MVNIVEELDIVDKRAKQAERKYLLGAPKDIVEKTFRISFVRSSRINPSFG